MVGKVAEGAVKENEIRLPQLLAVADPPPEDLEISPIVLRTDVRREQASMEVAEFVRANPGADAFDISSSLRLPPPLVKSVAEELVATGILRKGEEPPLDPV